jgi:hypothetical protein
MNQEIKNFIEKNGWEYKTVINDQFCIKTCPFCNDSRWKFYINSENWCWDCKLCGKNGGQYSLKMELGELKEISSATSIFLNKQDISLDVLSDYQKNLQNSPDAMEYLTKARGFSSETIENFKLGLEGDYIVIPHLYNGKFWNAKFRKFKGEKGFKRIAGQPSILFGLDNIDNTKQGLVIVESETDAIAATQLGIKNVVALTTGAQSFPPEWLSLISNFKQIYICLNSDIAGISGANKLIEKIGVEKCKNILLPTKDVNEYLLQTETLKLEPFYNFVKTKSTKAKLNDVCSMSDYVNNLDSWFESDGALSGLNIPFTKTNKYLNGFKEEDLIILSGLSGCGKSTFVLNLLNEFLKNGKHCLGFFLEGKIFFYILRMMCIESGKKIEDLRNDKEEWEGLKRQFASYPLYFYSGPQADISTKKIIDLSKSATKMFDINFIAIDNIQKFVRDDRNVVTSTSDAASQLKDLAVDLKIPVLVIAHVRKPEKNKKRVTMYDAKKSTTIFKNADIYLVIWDRKKEGSLEDDIILTIEKNRGGEGGIDLLMTFDKKIARFSERAEILNIDSVSQKIKNEVKKNTDETGWKSIVKSFENDSF